MNRSARNETPKPCPVEELATEAAALVRAIYALLPPKGIDERGGVNVPDLRGLLADEEGHWCASVRDRLRSRLYAIAAFAQTRRATSKKGAIFQMYLAGNAGSALSADLLDVDRDSRDGREIARLEERLDQLLFSALAALDDSEDPDLRLLKSWFYSPEHSGLDTEDLVLAELAKLAA